jgi:hypothetical protein
MAGHKPRKIPPSGAYTNKPQYGNPHLKEVEETIELINFYSMVLPTVKEKVKDPKWYHYGYTIFSLIVNTILIIAYPVILSCLFTAYYIGTLILFLCVKGFIWYVGRDDNIYESFLSEIVSKFPRISKLAFILVFIGIWVGSGITVYIGLYRLFG